MSTSHYGDYWRDVEPAESHIAVLVTCVDCGASRRVNIQEPNSWHFGGGNALVRIGLNFMAPIPDWPTHGIGAQQTKRCAACFEKHNAIVGAAQAKREAERRAAVEQKSVMELISDMLASDQPYKNTEYLKRVADLLKAEGR